MQDSALTPGNVLTLMNSSAKRPEMSWRCKASANYAQRVSELLVLFHSSSFLFGKFIPVQKGQEAMQCYVSLIDHLTYVFRPPSSLDMARSVRLIFVNWDMMSRIEELPALLLLVLQVAEEYQPGQATWK